MAQLELLVTTLALVGLSILLGGSMYDHVVLAPNFHGGPDGLEHGRLFMSRATPANLFRVAAPATQILLVVTLIATWGIAQCRWMVGGALVSLVVADVITFTFHYPRNRLMFGSPTTADPTALEVAAKQWAVGNAARVALVLLSWLGTLFALGAVVLHAYS